MESENKLVKVYSNNSKKAHLKRRKNKFQRVWDAEKQTYVKVRKSSFHMSSPVEKTEKNIKTMMAALKRRQTDKKRTKSVPTVKIKVKKTVENNVAAKKVNAVPLKARVSKPHIYKIYGINYTWNEKTLKYQKAAQLLTLKHYQNEKQ